MIIISSCFPFWLRTQAKSKEKPGSVMTKEPVIVEKTPRVPEEKQMKYDTPAESSPSEIYKDDYPMGGAEEPTAQSKEASDTKIQSGLLQLTSLWLERRFL